MQFSCAVCREPFEAKRPTAKYCGETCRKRAQRGGIAIPAPAPPSSRPVSGLTAAVRAELDVAGCTNSVPGQHALELASRIELAPDLSTGVAALSKELSRVLAEVRSTSTVLTNPLDELRARRDRVRRAG